MKRILLTGGTGDIGIAIQKEFKSQGFSVTAPTRKDLDLSSNSAIDSFFEVYKENIDAFVHCAGFNNPSSIKNLDLGILSQTMQINTWSCFRILQHLIPCLEKRKAKVVAISSLYGTIAREERAAYTMSKHALYGLIKTAALELAEKNILINTVSPGFVDTAMTRKNNSEEKIQFLKKKIPLAHLASGSEIAKVVYFLCSEQNMYITGQDIVVDGGFMAGGYQK